MELDESVQARFSHLLLRRAEPRTETKASRIALFRAVLLELRGEYDRSILQLSANDFAGISQLKKRHRDYCSSMLSLYAIVLKELNKDHQPLAYQKYYFDIVAALIRAFGPILYAKGAADCPLTQLLAQVIEASDTCAFLEK